MLLQRCIKTFATKLSRLEPSDCRLVCDCCGYNEQVAGFNKALIGIACFDCGDVLFTRHDWRAYKRSLIWAWFASWFPAGRKRWQRVSIRDGKIETQ